MTPLLTYLALSTLLCWLMLITASSLRSRIWTWQGWLLGVGNRDQVPEPSVYAARADRAAKNMLENLVLFAVLGLTVQAAGRGGEVPDLGAAVFFWARAVYWPLYVGGVTWLRTGAWAVGVGGMGVVAWPMFG
jgi:uncharacterized MAPEG superfamily protein